MAVGSPHPQVDTSKPHPARVYDYLLGGKDHYVVDAEFGAQFPEDAKRLARQNRGFMQRAVGAVAKLGTDQFLDIGTGIPTEPNLHQIVQAVNPAARIVYVDNDPIVLRHAEALLVGTPEGATDYLQADVRDAGTILDHARRTLDFSRPVALSLVALLHFVTDGATGDDAHGIVRTLVDALPSGSHLILSHATLDFTPETPESTAAAKAYTSRITAQSRNRAEVAGFFDGLDLLEPGLVTTSEWRNPEPPKDLHGAFYAAVGRVP